MLFIFIIFSGRCYDEVVDDSRKILRMAPEFVRASSLSLNRSQSIRSSKRHLAPSNKRYSMGAVPHSKCMYDLYIYYTHVSSDHSSQGSQGRTTPLLHKQKKINIFLPSFSTPTQENIFVFTLLSFKV